MVLFAHAAAFVFPTAAPRIAPVIRVVAPAKNRRRAQNDAIEFAVLNRLMNPPAGRIKSSLGNGAENGFVRARRRLRVPNCRATDRSGNTRRRASQKSSPCPE